MQIVTTMRRVRSFVRREGRMSAHQKQALTTLWGKCGLEVSDTPLDFTTIFGRDAACILEIGFGMGQSLLTMAKLQPEQNFIGIEVHRPGVGALLADIEKENVSNVRIFCADAIEVLQRCIPDNCLHGMQLFFPDPWPKRHHHKRRIVQPDFVQLVHNKLRQQGYFHLATDWQDYAEHMLKVLSKAPGFINNADNNGFIERPATRPMTKFERRGLLLGHDVWDLVFTKL